MEKQELLGKFIEALMAKGWGVNGQTRVESYRTRSFAYGGGQIVTTGGRMRLEKGGIKLTIGLNTICVYRRPENPDTIPGRGRLAGKVVYTFQDWPMRNISITKQQLEDIPELLLEVDKAVDQIKS